MKNIRAFIVCSSTILVVWLAASYSSELENTEVIAAPVTSAATSAPAPAELAMTPAAETDGNELASTVYLADIK